LKNDGRVAALCCVAWPAALAKVGVRAQQNAPKKITKYTVHGLNMHRKGILRKRGATRLWACELDPEGVEESSTWMHVRMQMAPDRESGAIQVESSHNDSIPRQDCISS